MKENINISTTEILLNNIFKIKSFNTLVSKYPDKHLFLCSGNHRINAKSLMGMLTLDLSKPVTLEFNADYEDTVKSLFLGYLM